MKSRLRCISMILLVIGAAANRSAAGNDAKCEKYYFNTNAESGTVETQIICTEEPGMPHHQYLRDFDPAILENPPLKAEQMEKWQENEEVKRLYKSKNAFTLPLQTITAMTLFPRQAFREMPVDVERSYQRPPNDFDQKLDEILDPGGPFINQPPPRQSL